MRYFPTRGPATEHDFSWWSGLTIGDDGAIYIADNGANRVRVIRDGIIQSLAGTGVPGFEGDGIALTQNSLAAVVGDWGRVFISVALSLFVFTSILYNYYLGENNLRFMLGENPFGLYGPKCQQAFGHLGFIAVLALCVLGLYMGLFAALATGSATWLRRRWSRSTRRT